MKYTITGRVIKGEGYGRKIGFPTVNLDTKRDKIKEFPKEGIYAGLGILEKKEYKAGIVIGPGVKIEAHLIGYSGNAYKKVITLEVKKFIREFQKFKTEEELIAQIKKDIKKC